MNPPLNQSYSPSGSPSRPCVPARRRPSAEPPGGAGSGAWMAWGRGAAGASARTGVRVREVGPARTQPQVLIPREAESGSAGQGIPPPWLDRGPRGPHAGRHRLQGGGHDPDLPDCRDEVGVAAQRGTMCAWRWSGTPGAAALPWLMPALIPWGSSAVSARSTAASTSRQKCFGPPRRSRGGVPAPPPAATSRCPLA